MRPLLCAALCAAAVVPAMAGEFAPGGSSGALARAFALPALGEPRVLARGAGDLRLTADVANEFVQEGDCDVECIVLDGETARLRLAWGYGFGAWDLRLEAPLLHRGGGVLDGWIQDWHGWIGAPNGGRERADDGRYEYLYRRDGFTRLHVTEPGTDVGDVTVGVGRRLSADAALRGLVKLPTGDARQLTGGNAGAAAWLDAALPLAAPWAGFAALGLSVNDRADLMPELQNRVVPLGAIGLLVPMTGAVRLHAQVQAHGTLYDGSSLLALARPGVPLTLGLQLRLGAGTALDAGIQEDLAVNGSPDFAAYVAVAYRGGP